MARGTQADAVGGEVEHLVMQLALVLGVTCECEREAGVAADFFVAT